MKRSSSYVKMRVLGAIEFAPGKTIKARIKHVSGMIFMDEDAIPHQFTWRTIQTWYSNYQKHGVTSMYSKTRSDKGKLRKVEPEKLLHAIEQVLPKFNGTPTNITAVYRQCIEDGHLRREEVAPNTFHRIVKKYELFKPQSETKNKRRLAFAKAHANEMWQADTMYGPYVNHAGKKIQTRLIAFIDDASRVCCHGEFFLKENTETLTKALRSALYKRGIPQTMYVDNGSIYCSKEINQVCIRIGCQLRHAPVRDGAAKGKVERFFRTVRDGFLTKKLDLSSVESLNKAFFLWVENSYNGAKHSSLGMRPIDRFGLERARIKYLSPNEANDELFFVEENRQVITDNTFQIKNIRFEAPRDLRNRKVQVRFNRLNFDKVFVYYKGERMGVARPVDFIANDRAPANRQESSK